MLLALLADLRLAVGDAQDLAAGALVELGDLVERLGADEMLARGRGRGEQRERGGERRDQSQRAKLQSLLPRKLSGVAAMIASAWAGTGAIPATSCSRYRTV